MIRSSQQLQDSRATAEEMSGIVIGMEADQIAMEDTQQELISDRQDSVNLTARERRVEEEANLDILL